MADLQRQIGERAQAAAVQLAKVGDVITEGPLPANVTAVKDCDSDIWHWSDREGYPWGSRPGLGGFTDGGLKTWYPLTVTAVREPEPAAEPQPTNDLLRMTSEYATMRERQAILRDRGLTPEADAIGERAQPLFAKIGAEVQRLRDNRCSSFSILVELLGAENLTEAKAEVQRLRDENSKVNGLALELAATEQMLAVALAAPQRDGPQVLTLPEVPEGAVALIDVVSGARWLPDGPGRWERDGREGFTLTLGEILASGAGAVTVETAPPREPRTWPKLDDAPEGLPSVRGASGRVWAPHDGHADALWCWTDGEGNKHGYEPFVVVQYTDGPLTEVIE